MGWQLVPRHPGEIREKVAELTSKALGSQPGLSPRPGPRILHAMAKSSRLLMEPKGQCEQEPCLDTLRLPSVHHWSPNASSAENRAGGKYVFPKLLTNDTCPWKIDRRGPE